MAGCAVQYPDGSAVCVAVGNNPYAGGFIYLVGSFDSGVLVPRERGVLALDQVHRARVSLDMRGESRRWIAPFEAMAESGAPAASGDAVRGRLTGDAGLARVGVVEQSLDLLDQSDDLNQRERNDDTERTRKKNSACAAS